MKIGMSFYHRSAVTEFGKPILTEWQLVGEAIRRYRFKSLIWDSDEIRSRDVVYDMVNRVRKFAGMKPMTREFFDEGEKLRWWLSMDYKVALEEFKLLCCGDW